MSAKAPDGTVFELTGPAEAPVVVLIHGLGLNRACWQWTIPALQGDYRLLTYDLYGHGQTVVPPQAPDLSLFSRQLGALLDHCGIDRATIAGFSLGGMIARRFAQDFPDRTRTLVILNSCHRRDAAAQKAVFDRVEQARTEGAGATVDAALARWFTEDFQAANPAIMARVRSWVIANPKDIYHTIYRVFAESVEEIVAPDPPLKCPALVITGDEDHGNSPEMAHAIAAEIPGTEVVVLPGLRHMALAEDPDAVNRPLRRFLDRLEPSP